ncbi:MAG: CBS domain-containing protein [Anaerolineales bacterium]|nr:CBS domain-containing protein [Anaerolineales bacterium]
MPYFVERLMENQGSAVVVQKADTVAAALDLMIEHDFSQLPVVDENRTLLGMITYESILRAARSFNAKLDELFVRDAMMPAPFHYREDDLFDLLDELKATNAVVIIEPGGRVIGVVTNYDAAEFLRSRTEDLMHIEDIEFIIKELIKRTYMDENGELNLDRLQTAIGKPRTRRGEQSGASKPKAFEDLNLGDYINLLMSRAIWNFCAPILDVQKESLYELLVKIRQTRNDLAHFRSEISPRSRDELKYCASWLRSRYQDYEKEQGSRFIDTLLRQHEEDEMARAAREESTAYHLALDADGKPEEGKTTSRSRYAALADWLAAQKEERVSLTFEQVEEIIRSRLPDSAFQIRAWWANDRVGHTHSILWLEAGWKVAYVDLGEEQVAFARIKPNEGGG